MYKSCCVDHGLVSLLMSSWGNDMSVNVVGANNFHHDSCALGPKVGISCTLGALQIPRMNE